MESDRDPSCARGSKIRYLSLPCLLFIFICSILILSFSSAHVIGILADPLDLHSAGSLVLYGCLMPALSTILVPITAICHVIYSDRRARPSICPYLALALSTLSLLGWLIQLSIWMNCELASAPKVSRTKDTARPTPRFCPAIHRDGTRTARILLAWMVVICYFAHVGAVGYGTTREKRRAGMVSRRKKSEEKLLQESERAVRERDELVKWENSD